MRDCENPVKVVPLKATNTGLAALPVDRRDELRQRYAELRADRTAPRPLRSYARAALAEIRAGAEEAA